MSMQNMWNEKFQSSEYLYGKAPNAFLKSQMTMLAKGSHILFLGEGEGRNACYAATQGFKVSALDASDRGIEKCQQLAKECGVSVETIHADLQYWKPSEHYDVVMCSFLHLPEPLRSSAFSQAIDALEPEGFFIAEFFSINQLKFSSGGPKALELLYDLKEMCALIERLHVTPYLICESIDVLDEGPGHQGEAALIRLVLKKES